MRNYISFINLPFCPTERRVNPVGISRSSYHSFQILITIRISHLTPLTAKVNIYGEQKDFEWQGDRTAKYETTKIPKEFGYCGGREEVLENLLETLSALEVLPFTYQIISHLCQLWTMVCKLLYTAEKNHLSYCVKLEQPRIQIVIVCRHLPLNLLTYAFLSVDFRVLGIYYNPYLFFSASGNLILLPGLANQVHLCHWPNVIWSQTPETQCNEAFAFWNEFSWSYSPS